MCAGPLLGVVVVQDAPRPENLVAFASSNAWEGLPHKVTFTNTSLQTIDVQWGIDLKTMRGKHPSHRMPPQNPPIAMNEAGFTRGSPRVLEAIQLRESPNQEAVACDRRCRHAHLIQRILAQQFVFRAGLKHEGIAVLAQGENFSVGGPGRGR